MVLFWQWHISHPIDKNGGAVSANFGLHSINCKSGGREGGREEGGGGRGEEEEEGGGEREGGRREGGRGEEEEEGGGGGAGGRTIDADLFCMSNNSDQASLPCLSCSVAQGGHS